MKKFFATLLVLALAACSPAAVPLAPTALPSAAASATASPTAIPTETPMPKPPFKVLAYLTAAMVPEQIPMNRLTHINYAFLLPKPDGSFTFFSDGWKLDKIVALAHPAGVKVLISVGGWGLHEQFAALAADPATRQVFVTNLAAFVEQHGLDGADIDWEYPAAGQQAQDFLALIQDLRKGMPGKLVTAAVVSYGENARGILPETLPLFDYLNVMTYDGPEHGTMQQFQDGLAYWLGQGVPPEKIVMGMPFYSRPSEILYRKIVEANPAAAYQDTVELAGQANSYNGIPTVQAKTRLALEKAGGVMFWTLDGDASGDLSLLKAIDETVHAAP